MSRRRMLLAAARSDTRTAVIARDGGCVAARHGLTGRCGGALEVHEVVSRARGGSILDPDNCVALCHVHHSWVTEHPAAAAEAGLSRASWER